MKIQTSKIKITKIETRYILTDGKYTISVAVADGGKSYSIYRQSYFNQGFDFVNSSPELIERIAKLLLEAVRLK